MYVVLFGLNTRLRPLGAQSNGFDAPCKVDVLYPRSPVVPRPYRPSRPVCCEFCGRICTIYLCPRETILVGLTYV